MAEQGAKKRACARANQRACAGIMASRRRGANCGAGGRADEGACGGVVWPSFRCVTARQRGGGKGSRQGDTARLL
jgi:hypothetical protein